MIIDQASATGRLQNSFKKCSHPDVFLPHVLLCAAPRSPPPLICSLLGGSHPGLGTYLHCLANMNSSFLQVVQLHVGEEVQPGTFEGGAEEARGE